MLVPDLVAGGSERGRNPMGWTGSETARTGMGKRDVESSAVPLGDIYI